MNETQESDAEAVPKVALSLECPFCGKENAIMWLRDAAYIIAPK